MGGAADGGIDVEIRDSNSNLWAVAQCKRYAYSNKVGPAEIREFGGAFALSKAGKGFYFTTGVYTTQARETAASFDWLTAYDADQLIKLIRTLEIRYVTPLLP